MKYRSISNFPRQHATVTPSDTVDIPEFAQSEDGCGIIYCQSDGTCQAVDFKGTVKEYTLVAGDIVPVRCRRINATSTTGVYYALF